ncbi:MAG TPA: alkaline phosphatase family protein [Gemmatimonadota bacterium]|nr:alkaline phosphatase family protein [Gemmatimonadota bacterium]
MSALSLAALSSVAGCRSTPPGAEVLAIDEDGDGRTDLWRAPDGSAEVRAPEPGSDPPRTVVLAIDAIPHDLFAELQREGRFRAFLPASRLVAPFPSLTNLGFTAIFRTPAPSGYEDLYFDPERDAVVGGAWERLTGEYKGIAPFHERFDWEEPRLWGAFVFYLPDRVREAELLRIEEILMDYARDGRDPPAENDAELLLYMGSTDALGHVGGREALRRHLLRVESVLGRFLAAGGGRDRVILLSDHGMSEESSRLFDLEAALGRAGFRLADAVRDTSDVVAPAYGLVGSIQLYTAPGQEEAVARAVVAQQGADFAVWRRREVPSAAEGLNGRGREGGPARLPARIGAVDAEGSADPLDRPSDDYPMLRERVRRALDEPTRHPADVLVSLEDGWHYGSALFDRLVRIRGTHGSARASSSVGFLASNVDQTPLWIPAWDAWPWLGLEGDDRGDSIGLKDAGCYQAPRGPCGPRAGSERGVGARREAGTAGRWAADATRPRGRARPVRGRPA